MRTPAGPDMETDSQFFEVLGMMGNSAITGRQLSLHLHVADLVHAIGWMKFPGSG